MADLSILKDPGFAQLPKEDQTRVRLKVFQSIAQDPDYAKLPEPEKQKLKGIVLGGQTIEPAPSAPAPNTPEPPPQAPQEPGFWSSGIPGALKQGAAGAMDMVMGLPGDLVKLANPVGRHGAIGGALVTGDSGESAIGSQAVKEHVTDPLFGKPEGMAQEFARQYAGPFVAGAMIPVGGSAVAARALPTAGKVATEAGRALASAGGAYGGGKASEALAPDNPIARFVAENLGAVTPVGIEALVRGASRLFPSIREEALRAEIGKELRQKLGPDFDQRYAEAQDIGTTIQAHQPPGSPNAFNPTTAGIAGTPEAIQLERAGVRSVPGMGNELFERRATGVQAGREALGDVLGAPEGTTQGAPEVKRAIEQTQAFHEGQYAKKAARATGNVRSAEASLDDILDQRRAGRMSDVEAGEQIYGTFKSQLADAKAEATRAYQDAAIPGEVIGSSKPTVDAAKAQIKRLRASVDSGNFPTEALDRLTSGTVLTGKDDLMHLESIRSDLLNLKRSAAARQNRKLGSNIDELVVAIDNNQEQMATTAGKLDAYERLVSARDQYRTTVVEPFVRGPVGQTMKPGRAGEAPGGGLANIPKKLSASEESMAQFESFAGNNPEARKAMTDYLMNDLQSTAVNPRTGAFDQGKFRAWRTEHDDAIQRLPELSRQVEGVESGATTLGQAQTKLSRVSTAHDTAMARQKKSALSKFMNAEPEREIASVMSSGNPSEGLRQLKRAITNPRTLRNPTERQNAMLGLKRELRDWMEQKIEAAPHTQVGDQDIHLAKSNQMRLLLDTYEPALRQVYGAKEVDALKQINKGMELMQRSDRVPFAGSPTSADMQVMKFLGLMFGNSTMGLGGRAAAVGAGLMTGHAPLVGVGLAANAGWRFMKHVSAEKRMAILSEAMMNPEVAKKLVDLSKAQPGPAKLITQQLQRMVTVQPSRLSTVETEENPRGAP